MHGAHREAAEQHELASRAHRTAAEHNERGDNETGNWHSRRALDYSDRVYKLAKEAHTKSGQIIVRADHRSLICPLDITTDPITRTINEPLNYTRAPRMPIALPSTKGRRIT
jgi:hypothetical protein